LISFRYCASTRERTTRFPDCGDFLRVDQHCVDFGRQMRMTRVDAAASPSLCDFLRTGCKFLFRTTPSHRSFLSFFIPFPPTIYATVANARYVFLTQRTPKTEKYSRSMEASTDYFRPQYHESSRSLNILVHEIRWSGLLDFIYLIHINQTVLLFFYL
jgi:hypothetical protein